MISRASSARRGTEWVSLRSGGSCSSPTADVWVLRLGFERIARDVAPAALHGSAEFRGACQTSPAVTRPRFRATDGPPYDAYRACHAMPLLRP